MNYICIYIYKISCGPSRSPSWLFVAPSLLHHKLELCSHSTDAVATASLLRLDARSCFSFHRTLQINNGSIISAAAISPHRWNISTRAQKNRRCLSTQQPVSKWGLAVKKKKKKSRNKTNKQKTLKKIVLSKYKTSRAWRPAEHCVPGSI